VWRRGGWRRGGVEGGGWSRRLLPQCRRVHAATAGCRVSSGLGIRVARWGLGGFGSLGAHNKGRRCSGLWWARNLLGPSTSRDRGVVNTSVVSVYRFGLG
jgi:hypothetical protein